MQGARGTGCREREGDCKVRGEGTRSTSIQNLKLLALESIGLWPFYCKGNMVVQKCQCSAGYYIKK